MIKLDVSQLLRARGITRPAHFLRKLGLSGKVAHRILNDEPKSLNFDHVFRICVALQCTPNDLLRLDSDTLPKTHPLRILRNKDIEVDLLNVINGVPLSKLSDLKEVIDRLKASSDGV